MAKKSSSEQSTKQTSSSKPAKSSKKPLKSAKATPKKVKKTSLKTTVKTPKLARGRPKKASFASVKVKVSHKMRPTTVESAQQTSQAEKKQYFTKLHEEAIIKYAGSSNREEKSVLYITLIQPAFNEMVDKIVYTYKFTSLPNIEDLKDECKIWLTTILEKFDVTKGSKAFSYFSVITKNWFIHKAKKNNSGKEVGLDDITQEFEEDNLYVTNGYDEKREYRELWTGLWQEMDSWDTTALKGHERKVYEAIKILLRDPDSVQILNKKAVYLYLRELTGLTTKQIVSGLKKFKVKYNYFIGKWNRGAITHLKDEEYGKNKA